jgi:hypothetical protein
VGLSAAALLIGIGEELFDGIDQLCGSIRLVEIAVTVGV